MIEYLLYWGLFIWLHEMAHFLFLLAGKVSVEKIVLGNFIFIKLPKIWLSPFLLSSYVEFDESMFSEKSRLYRAMMYLSGPSANLLLFIIIPSSYIICNYLNLLIFLLTILPLSNKSDGVQAVKELLLKNS